MKKEPLSSVALEAAALSISAKSYSYRLALAVCLAVLVGYCLVMETTVIGIFVLVILDLIFCADVVFKNAWRDIENGRFSTSVLAALSLVAGLSYGVSKTFLTTPLAGQVSNLYMPMTVLLVFYLWHCSHLVRSKERTNVFIKKLDDFLPKSGRLLQGRREMMAFADELKPGDIIRVKAGERIPCEGIIARGETAIDESLITGNMMPTAKKIGGAVYAGTLNKGSEIMVRVEKNLQASAIMGIIQSIKNSERRRCTRKDVLDNYAPWILCWAVLLAVVAYVYFYWEGGYSRPFHNLGFLLLILGISCPWSFLFCAVLPSYFLKLGAKGHKIDLHAMGALEILDQSDVVFFDKTGTLTYGELRVASVHAGNETARKRLLSCLATAEQFVDGPFATAIMIYTQAQKVQPKSLRCFDVLPGLGIRAVSGKDVLLAGRPEWLREQGMEVAVGPHDRQAVVCGAKNGKCLGYVLLDDQLRPGAADMVQSLQKKGKEVILMSGDNEASVSMIAAEAGIEKFNFGVLPQTKAEILGNYASLGKKTVMVGDGFNDITALLRSEAGVVFSSGKNVYNNWVDVVIRRGDLHSIVDLFGMYSRLSNCILSNVVFSILCNIILLVGVLFMPEAIWQSNWIFPAGLSAGVILVVLNSMRLLRVK